MMSADKGALECDLAQYYQIYDMRELPLHKVALFSCGLPDDSRIKRKMSGQKVPLDTILLANILDRLSILVWHNTKDGQNGRNKPPMVADILLGITREDEKKDEIVGFANGEAFEIAKAKILKERREKA